jgi:hypothetical protein
MAAPNRLARVITQMALPAQAQRRSQPAAQRSSTHPTQPQFTGRGDLLAALRQQLTTTPMGAVVQASAVHGLRVGKTQLAIEYPHRDAAD